MNLEDHSESYKIHLFQTDACDKAVIRLLRERGLGNSPSQLQKKICEQIGAAHLSRTPRYLGHCAMRSVAAAVRAPAAAPGGAQRALADAGLPA